MVSIPQIFVFSCIYCVAALQFSGSVDKMIRQALLDGLRRFHAEEALLYVPDLNIESIMKSSLSFSSDLNFHIFVSFLDSKSLSSLMRASVFDVEYLKQIRMHRLAGFHPRFVFENDFHNELLLAVLDKHFTNSKSFDSENTKDELQVLILKWNYDRLDYKSIPKNIYFYLIAFINGAVYGINSTVPIDKQDCCIDSVRFVRTQVSCSRTIELLDQLELSHGRVYNDLYYDKLHFFADKHKPSKEQVKIKFKFENINSWVFVISQQFVPTEIKIAVYETFIDDLTNEGITQLYLASPETIVKSSSLIDRFLLINEWIDQIRFEVEYARCVKHREQLENAPSHCKNFLETNTNEMPLEGDPFQRLSNPELLLRILDAFSHYRSRCNLYQIELYSRCVTSNLVTSNNYSIILRDSFFDKYFYFEVLIKESPYPFKLFCIELILPVPVFEFIPKNMSFLETFFELLNSEDPIILFMFREEILEVSRRFITNKFDLNKTYKFVDRKDDRFCLNAFRINLGRFAGKTMHFKQIVKELKKPKLFEIFSSNPHEFEGEFEADLTCPPVFIDQNMGSQYFKH